MKKTLIVIGIFGLFLCIPAQSHETSKWKSIGPYGGSIEALAVNPQDANECFAVGNTSGGYIYWSKNGGNSWQGLYDFPDSVYDLAVDSTNPDILFALGSDHLYKSIDKGKSWSEKSFNHDVVTKNSKIALNLLNPNKIFIIGKDKANSKQVCILKSTDSAESWKRQVIGTVPMTIKGYNIAISPSNPNVLYSSAYYTESSGITYKSQLFKSTDGGQTWTNLSGEISNAVNAIAIDPFNPSKVYLGTNWEVIRSSDGGQTWEDSADYVYSKSLAVDRSNPDILYSGYNSCCYRSDDGGVHWKKYLCETIGSCNDLLPLPESLLYASDVGVYRSSNGGENWEGSHDGISKVCIKTVSITKTFPIKIYALPYDGEKLYVSEDFGITWNCPKGLDSCGSVAWIEAHPEDSEKAFISAAGGG